MTIDQLLILAAAPQGIWIALWDILVLLTMALVLGTVAEKFGQSVIVGYLIAGTVVGPNVLAWISTERELFNIAELGVALLLFTIGLEFSPQRLLSLGSMVLKTGPLQVILTATLGFGGAVACGLGAGEAMVVGMMVAVSSTACVLRLLTDRAEIDSEHGRTAMGILLIQDAAVIPMMLLVSIIDLNSKCIAIACQYGLSCHLGDATRRDILEHAGIYRARVVVITVPDHATARHLIHLVRELAPSAFIIARCRYHVLHWELLHAGAHEVVDEEDQLGRRLAAHVRKFVGKPDADTPPGD